MKNKEKPHISRMLSATIRANRIWIVSLVAGVILGCSPNITDKNQLSGALKWRTSVVEGDNQSALPKQSLDEPIVVQILDADGKPIKDASVEAVLVDSTGLEDKVGIEVLAQKWEEKLTQAVSAQKTTGTNPAKGAASSATGATAANDEEDRLGRIEKLETRTDANGKARVWVRVPSKFQKTVKIIIRAGASGVFGAAYTVATLASKDFKTGASLFFKTTNENKENAGDEFDITLTIKDSSGNTASSFEGDYKVKIEASPTDSWAGIKPNFPNAEVNCRFFGGVCLVPKSPFRLVAPEELKVKVSFVSDIIPPTDDSIVVQPKGEKKHLVLKNHEGALRGDSQPITEISKQAGSETSLTAAWIDEAGNYIEDAKDVTWSIDNPLLNAGLPAGSTATTVAFKPLKTGSGYLRASAEGKSLLKDVKLNIPSGPFVQWGVRVGKQDNPNTMTAGECASVDVFAADEFLNANSEVNLTAFPIRLSIENGDLQPYVAKRAFFEGSGSGQNIRTMNVTLKNGEASGIEKVCLFDAKTSINPKIQVLTGSGAPAQYASYVGLSERIQVNKGAASRIGLVFNDGTDKHVCWAYESDKFQDKDDPCIVEEVAELTTHKQELEFKTVVFDSAGNVVAKAASVWQQFQSAAQVLKTSPLFAIDSATDSTTVAVDSPWKLKLAHVVDGGTVNTIRGSLLTGQFTSISGTARDVSYSFFVSPRKPNKAVVEPCVENACLARNTGLKTTDQFGIRLRFVNSSGLRVDSFVTRPPDGYPRKRLYRVEKPTGDLLIKLDKTAGATLLSGLTSTPFPVRQGLANLGSLTPDLVDYEANMTQTAVVDSDGTFLFPRTSSLYFHSPKALSDQRISGTIQGLSIGGQNLGTLTVESNDFEVVAGDPWQFKVIDPNNGDTPYDDFLGSRILIQQTPKNNASAAKSIVVWGIDKYGNEIRQAQPMQFTWQPTPGSATTCNESAIGGEVNVANPFVRIAGGNNLRDSGQISTPNSAEGYRVHLNSPCNIKGRIKITPSFLDTYDTSFLSHNSNQKQYLPELEFVGDVEHHFLVEAIPVGVGNPETTTSAANGLVGLTAGTRFYLRLIPVVFNGLNHAAAYADSSVPKTLNLRGVFNQSWAKLGENILPPSDAAGQTYQCFFNAREMTPNYSEAATKNDVPVCLIKGPQILREIALRPIVAGEKKLCDSDERIIKQYTNETLCEKESGFSVAAATSGAENKVILIRDDTASSNIVDDDTYNYNSLRLNINAGAPSRIVLSNKCGGPSNNAAVWNTSQPKLTRTIKTVDEYSDESLSSENRNYYQITADDIIEIVATAVDAQGNWVKDLTLPAGSSGVSVSAGLGNYLSEAGLQPSIIRTEQAVSALCPRNAHTLMTISPKKAAAQSSLVSLGAPGSKAQFDTLTIRSSDTATSQYPSPVELTTSLTLAVRPGLPATAAVTTERVDLSNSGFVVASHASGSATTLSPGDCAIIQVSAHDSDNNKIYDSSGSVTVGIRAKNYYTAAAGVHLFQPGGLFKRIGTENRLTPITTTTPGWVGHPNQGTFSTTNGGVAQFAPSDSFENDSATNYVGHENLSNMKFEDGDIKLNRYMCVFDQTLPTPGPSVAVTLTGGSATAPYSISGESAAFSMQALTASVIDVRDASDKRVCPLPNGGSSILKIPRRMRDGASEVFKLDTDVGGLATCKATEVSSTPAGFKSYITDAVGNNFSGTISTTSSNYVIATGGSCPTGSDWCVRSSGLGHTGLQQAGEIVANASSGGLAREIRLKVLSKTPKEFTVFVNGQSEISATGIVSADNRFNLTFQAKDQYGNFIDDPDFSHTMTANLSYYVGGSASAWNASSSAVAADAANGSPGAAPQFISTPLTFTFNNGTGKWQASTAAINNAGFFHFKNNSNGSVTVKLTATFSKPGSANQVSTQTSFPVTITTGVLTQTIITEDSSSTELPLPSGTPNYRGIVARSSAEPYFFRTASFDQYMNSFVSATPAENAITVTCASASPPVAACTPVAADPGRIQISVQRSGDFTMYATRGGIISTITYNLKITAGTATKVTIIPKPGSGFNPATDILNAGDAKNFNLQLTDDFNNIVDSINSTWSVTWAVGETYPDIPLGGEKVLFPASNTCAFTNGVCTNDYNITFRGASSSANDGKITVQLVNGATTLNGSLAVRTNPTALHSFNVKKVGAIAPQARRDNNSAAKFAITISSHDIFGNLVTAGENTSIKLNLVRPDGTKTFFPESSEPEASRAGNGLIRWGTTGNSDTTAVSSATDTGSGQTRDSNGVSILSSGSSSLSINNLAYDDPGEYKILATDQSGITTPLTRSETITFQSSIESLKDFYLDVPAAWNLVAGQQAVMRVIARSHTNRPLRGIDNVISNSQAGTTSNFLWNVSANSVLFGTPASQLDSTGATLPTTFTFVDGISNVPFTFQKVSAASGQTIRNISNEFRLKGSISVGALPAITFDSVKPAGTVIQLNPNALHEYRAEVTGLSGSPTATLASRFNLTVRALDQYENPRPGETGLNVVAEKSTNSSLLGFSSSTTILRQPNTTDNQFADGFTNFSPNEIDLSNGVWTATGLVYLVPQTVKFTLSGAAVAVNSTNNNNTAGGYIPFAPLIGTVKAYTISLNTGTDDLSRTGQYRTHDATNLTVMARDIEGNAVPNLESSLNAQTYVWDGASTLALTSDAPGYPTSPAFNSVGTWATSVNFKATQSFLANTLTMRDNYSVAAGEDFRTGGNASPFTIYSRHKDYTLDAGGANVDWLVNTPSQLKITARGYDNLPVREFDAKLNAFQFDWSGSGFAAAPNNALAVFGNNTTKTGKTFTFSNGVAFVNITPFKKESISGAAVILTDNSAASPHFLGTNKIGELTGTVNVRAGTVTRYELNAHVSNTTTRNRTADNDAATGRFTLDILPTDAYHNPTVGEAGLAISTNGGAKTKTTLKSSVSSFNSESIDLTTGLDATTGKKSFSNVYYPVPDAGMTFGLSNTAATITPTLSITFDATEKSIVGYNLTVEATQTAGAAFTVTLTPKDVAGNTLTTLSSGLADLQSRRFNLTGPANAPNGNVPLANGTAITGAKNINPNFTAALVGTINVTLLRKETIAAGAFVLEDNFTTPLKAISTNAIVVQSAAPSALHSANLPGVRAGQQIEIKAYLKDIYGNTSFTGCGAGTANGLYGLAGWNTTGVTYSNAPADVTPGGVFATTSGKAPEYKTLAASGADVTSSARVTPDATNGDEMKMYVTLYKKGKNQISLAACSQTLVLPVDVIEANTAVLARITTDATRPTVATPQSEVECLHSGANPTSAQVICPTIYSYFWDTYGNTFADGTGQCSWTGAKANAADPTTLPSIAGSATSLQPTHSGPVNVNLTCTGPNATSASLLAFGGISSWQATVIPKTGSTAVTVVTPTGGNLSGAANKAAVGIPLVVKEIVTRRYKGNSSSLETYTSASATSHTMSVDVSNFGGSGVTNIPATMTANLTTAGITSAADVFNFPFTTAYTDKTLILTLRGIPLTITNITVDGGIAETIALDAAGTTAPALPIAGTTYAIKIDVKDSAANLANCTSINVSVVGGGSHASPGNNAAIPGAAETLLYDTTQTIPHDSGFIGRFTVPVMFVKAETISLEFTTLSATCGAVKSFQQTYTIQPKTDANMHARLSTDGTTPPTQHTNEVSCALGAGLALQCPTLYLHTWDFYGNYIANTTCDASNGWTWTNFDNLASTANGTSETPSLASGALRSQTLAISSPDVAKGFLDGKLTCARAETRVHRNSGGTPEEGTGITPATEIRTIVTGGLKGMTFALEAKNESGTFAASASPITSLRAASDNVKVKQITAKKRRLNVDVVKNDFVTSATESITLTTAPFTTSSNLTENSRTLTSGTSPLMSSTTLECKFTADGICRTPADTAVAAEANMTFAVVESVARKVVFNLRGKTSEIVAQQVTPAAPASVVFPQGRATANNSPVAGNAVIETVEVKDAFGNKSTCDKLTVSKQSGTADAPADGTTVPGTASVFAYNSAGTVTGSNAGSGSLAHKNFVVSLNLYRAENIAMRFATDTSGSNCGDASVQLDHTYSVSAKTDTGMHARLSTNGDTRPTQHTEEIQCPLGAGLALQCPTLYLHTWDFYGNYIANTTCDASNGWTWTNFDNLASTANGTSETPSLTSGALRSQTLTAAGTASGFMDGKLTCARAETRVHRNGGGTPEEGTGITPATDIRTIVTGGLKGMTFALEAKNASGTFAASASPITTLLAASDNVKVKQITAKKRRLNLDVVKNDFVISATESITFTTAPFTTGSDATENSRTLASGTSPLMNSTTLECKFTADGICRTPADTAVAAEANITFAVVESVARKVVFNLRGKTSEIVVQQVTPAAPASVVFPQGRAAANNSPVAGNTVSETIEVKDAFGNKSTCDKLTVSKTSATTADAPADGTTVPGTASVFAYNSAGTVTGSNFGEGFLQHKNFAVSLNFYRAENIAMRFATDTNSANCGTASVQLNHTYSVSAKTDAGMHARLSTNGDTRPTQHTEEIQCPLGAGLAMNCPALYAHVWDAYGNYVSNATCDSWTWNHYDAISGATETSEVPQAASGAITAGTAFAPNTRSQTLTAAGTASGFMDGRLVCNRASTTLSRPGTDSIDTANTAPLQTVVYGGIKGIEISAQKVTPATNYGPANAISIPDVKAAADNVQLKELKAFVRRYGAQTAKSDFVAGQNETVVVTTSSTGTTAEQSRTLASGAHPISTNSALTCAFDNVGICKDPATPTNSKTMNLNFKVVESAARTITFSLRGKQATLAVTAVTPANAANVTLAVKNGGTETAALNVRQAFSVEAEVKDGFGNATTLKSADGSTCAVADASATLNHTTPTATGTALGNAASVSAATWNGGGVYTFNVANTLVTLAGAKSVSVNACGVSANSAALTFNPGSLASIVLRNSAAINTTVNTTTTAVTLDANVEHVRCPLQTSGPGVNCPTVYSYFFDQDNNAVSGKSCHWIYAHNATSASAYGAQMTLPTQSSGNGTISNTLTHLDFMDGTLTCAEANDNSKTRTIDLYGGVAKVALAWNAKGRDASGGETTSANGTTMTAGENNFQLAATTGIKLVGPVRGTNDTLVPDAGTSVPVTFTTTAPNNVGQSALPTNVSNCDFSTNVGICNNQSYNFNFKTTNVGGTAYQATVSARGKTATISGITVQPANAASLALTAKMGTSVVTTVTTDDSFDVYAQVKDQYGNFTDLNTSYATCPAPVADGSTTPIDTAGVQANAKAGATPDNSLLPVAGIARVPAKEGGGSVGLYKYSNFNLTGIQANGADANSSLKFQLCSVAQNTSGSTLTLTVKPGKPKNVFVNTSTTASRTNMADTLCTLNGSGAGATCAPMYAYFFDANENLITNANGGQCTTWSVANIPTGNPVGLTTPNISTAASNNQTFTSTGAFSLALTCNNIASGFVPTTVKLRGGIAQIALTWTAKTLDTANAAVSTASGRTVDAQNENFTIESATFQTYDFNATPTLISLAQGTTNEALQITTTASAGPTNVNPVPAGAGGVLGETTCNMADGVCTPATAGEIAHNVHKITLNKAGETGRSVTVSARGLSATISGLTVNSGAMVAANRLDSIPTTATIDSPLTSGALELFDMYNNRTQKNCSDLALAYQYSSNGGTSFEAATTGTGSNTRAPDATDPTLPATITVNGITTGRYDLPATAASALKFVKPGTYRLTPTVCGQTLATKDITVSLGAVAKVKLFNSTPSDPYPETAPTGPIECGHTTAAPADDNQPAVACATFNAYFFDSRGNRITDAGTAKCTNWIFEKNANSSDSQTLSGLTAGTASTTPTATDWIDGTLRCDKGGTAGGDLAPQLTIFGGTHSVASSFNTTSPNAGNNNVTLNSLTIYQRKLGSTVLAATARTNEKVGITTTATQAASGSPSAVLSGSTYTCNSAAETGVCTGTVPNISLTKVETTPSITLKLRGKTVATTFTVNPGTVSSATLTLGAASPWTSGSSQNAQFQPKDTFGNPSQSGCATITGSNANTAPSSQAPSYGTVGAWTGGATGHYPITGIALYGASATAQALTYTCGPTTSIFTSQNIVVNAGTTSQLALTTSNAAPTTFADSALTQDLKCTLSSGTNINTGLTCPTVYAWTYDASGNATADNTCQWQKSDWTSSWSTAANIAGAGTTSSLNSATLAPTGALNAKLSCAGKTMRNANNIYGGVSRIALVLGQANTQSTSGSTTTYTTTAANFKAAPSNLIITQLNAYSQRESTEVSLPLAAGTTNLTLSATYTGVENTSPNGTSFDLDTSKLTCSFSAATAQCSTPIEFTFKKVHATASTRPQISLDLKSKTAIVNVSPITEGNGATLNLTGWPANAPIGANIINGAKAQVKDMYGNNSSLSPSGEACSGAAVLTGFQASVFTTGTYANSLTTPATNTGTGLYSITASVYKVANHAVTIAACGLSRAETLVTTAGTFARALITTSATAPANYTCTSGDLCDEVLPTCTAANTASCGPFRVWKYDLGGNPLYTNNTTPDDCGTTMNGITVTNDGDATAATPAVSGATVTSFNITAGAAGKHILGKIQCTVSTINRGNRIIFKAPTKRAPEFKCYPWGIDNTGNPEALCTVTNDTGYIISNVNIARCDSTNTTGARCSSYTGDSANQDIANYSISSHCFNLPTKEATGATRFAGHRCSVIISGVIDKRTAPFWVQAESPDLTKVVFDDTPQVRIPRTYINAVQFTTNTSTCAASTNYHSSVAAGCAITSDDQNSGNNTLAAKQTASAATVVGLIYDGHTTDCNRTYPERRVTLQVQAVNNPDAFGANPTSLLDTTNDYVSIESHDTCNSADLGNNGTCKVKLFIARPFNETTIKIGSYYVRTGEAARCPGTTKDL